MLTRHRSAREPRLSLHSRGRFDNLHEIRGLDPVRLLNRIHGHHDIPNDEFRYVLATTIVGPVRWIDE